MPRFTRFDATVLVAALVLAAAIGLTAVIAAPPPDVLGVAFLGPAIASNQSGQFTMTAQNVYISDIGTEDSARQVTFEEDGIYDFAVSADGRYIAYSVQDADTGITEIMLLDTTNNVTRQLTNCINEDAICNTPVWRPDGTVIAYERRERNTELGLPISAPRVWLLDLTTDPVNDFPLFQESQILTHSPRWSGDGERIAVYDSVAQNIVVYDFTATTEEAPYIAIPSTSGAPGALSPNGRYLVFQEIALRGDNQPVSVITRVADLDDFTFTEMYGEADLVDDGSAVWHPDGQRVTIARRYLQDDRATVGLQIYMVDRVTRQTTPLIIDDRYTFTPFGWTNDGTRLIVQRYPMVGATANSVPEIMVYDIRTGTLTRLAGNFFFPDWVE